MSPKRVLIPVAEGSEDIEVVTLIDVLRRAEAQVVVASVESGLQLQASRGTRLLADCRIDACVGQSYDLIALPGGVPGAEHLRDSPELIQLLLQQHQQTRLIGAICAAPALVLAHHGLLAGKNATAFPSYLEQLPQPDHSEAAVIEDGHIITSRAAGTAMAFSLVLVERLFDAERAEQIAQQMLVKRESL